jgi:hypothetical protein
MLAPSSGHQRHPHAAHATPRPAALFRAFVFSAWALALSLVGLWLLGSPRDELPAMSPVFLSAGLAALAAGQILFMTMVADRSFPRAFPRLVAALELLALAVFLAGTAAFAWLSLSGVSR